MSSKLTENDIRSLIGIKVGRLVISEYKGCYEVKKSGKKHWYRCECDCGNTDYVITRNLLLSSVKNKNNISCGCLKKENTAKIHPKNNIKDKYPSFYNAWQNMKSRCNDLNNEFYHCYGGRGIIYNSKWENFNGFYEDMFSTWEKGLTLDRIDVNGNYEKDNCRWATWEEQANNRRSNVRIKINDEEMLLTEWSETSGVPIETIWSRLHRGVIGEDLIKNNPRNTLDKQSGIKGVRWSKKDERWVIDKIINGKKKRLGTFKEYELDKAIEYYNKYALNQSK